MLLKRGRGTVRSRRRSAETYIGSREIQRDQLAKRKVNANFSEKTTGIPGKNCLEKRLTLLFTIGSSQRGH
jgi:hypothetical protein